MEEITEHLTKGRGKEDFDAYTKIFESCMFFEEQFWQDVYIQRLPEGLVRPSALGQGMEKGEPEPQEPARECAAASNEEKKNPEKAPGAVAVSAKPVLPVAGEAPSDREEPAAGKES